MTAKSGSTTALHAAFGVVSQGVWNRFSAPRRSGTTTLSNAPRPVRALHHQHSRMRRVGIVGHDAASGRCYPSKTGPPKISFSRRGPRTTRGSCPTNGIDPRARKGTAFTATRKVACRCPNKALRSRPAGTVGAVSAAEHPFAGVRSNASSTTFPGAVRSERPTFPSRRVDRDEYSVAARPLRRR